MDELLPPFEHRAKLFHFLQANVPMPWVCVAKWNIQTRGWRFPGVDGEQQGKQLAANYIYHSPVVTPAPLQTALFPPKEMVHHGFHFLGVVNHGQGAPPLTIGEYRPMLNRWLFVGNTKAYTPEEAHLLYKYEGPCLLYVEV